LRKEPTVHGQYRRHAVRLHGTGRPQGLDRAWILEPGAEHPSFDKIFHDEASIRRLVGRSDSTTLRVCYEAGPTGYRLARLLASMNIDCQVIAPSLTPHRAG